MEVWEPRPDDGASPPGWAFAHTARLECPSGQLVLSDSTGSGFDGIDPPQGPGAYHVSVYHRGREHAQRAQRTILAAMRDGNTNRQVNDLEQQSAGIEQYLIRLSRQAPA